MSGRADPSWRLPVPSVHHGVVSSLVQAESPRDPQPGSAVSARTPGRRSAADLVRTLAVVLVLVGAIVLLVPRPNAVVQPPVNLASAAQAARGHVGFKPSVPAGLPSGWTPTSAQVRHGTADVEAWHVGFVTPAGSYAGLEQAASPPRAWENAQVVDGAERGTTTIDGRTWVIRSRPDRNLTALVLRGPNVTTVVGGKASRLELEELVHSLPLPD